MALKLQLHDGQFRLLIEQVRETGYPELIEYVSVKHCPLLALNNSYHWLQRLCNYASTRQASVTGLHLGAPSHVALNMVLRATQSISSSGLQEIVEERRSIRAFSHDDVPLLAVRDLLEAAAWAPSPHNSQPWRFTVLTKPKDKVDLADVMADQLAAELRVEGRENHVIEAQTKRSRMRISAAPVVILCSLTHDGLVTYPDERRNALEWEMAVQSVGAVLQTLFLLAHERGLGTCWMAAPLYCPELVKRALNLAPTFSPQALVLMGYPAMDGKVRERRPIEEIVDCR